MSKRTITFLLLALLLSSSAPSWAIVYYASTGVSNGYGGTNAPSDANACTSAASPCLTVTGALGKATPTVININPTATPYVEATFTSAAVAGLTLQTDPTLVAAQGKAIVRATAGQTRVINVNASNVTLNDLIIDATGLTSASGVTFQSGTGITVNRCDVKNVASSGFHGFNQSGANTVVAIDKSTVTTANGNNAGVNFSNIGASGCSIAQTGCTGTGISTVVNTAGATTPTATVTLGASSDGTRGSYSTTLQAVKMAAAGGTYTVNISNCDFSNCAAFTDNNATSTFTLNFLNNTMSGSTTNTGINLGANSVASGAIAYNSFTSNWTSLQFQSTGITNFSVHDNYVNTPSIGSKDNFDFYITGTGISFYNNNITSASTAHIVDFGTDSYGPGTSNTAVSTGSQNLGDTSSDTYVDQPFTAYSAVQGNGAQYLGAIFVGAKKVGSPTGTVTCSLFSDSAGNPNVSQFLSDYTVSASKLSTSFQQVCFWSSARYQQGYSTNYHIVLRYTGTVDGANYVQLDKNASATTLQTSTNGSSWSAGSGSLRFLVGSLNLENVSPNIYGNTINGAAGGTSNLTHMLLLSNSDGGLVHNNQYYGGGLVPLKQCDGSVHFLAEYDELFSLNGVNNGTQTWAMGSKSSNFGQFYQNTVVIQSGSTEGMIGNGGGNTGGTTLGTLEGTNFNNCPSRNDNIFNNVTVDLSNGTGSSMVAIGGSGGVMASGDAQCIAQTFNNNVYYAPNFAGNTLFTTQLVTGGSVLSYTSFPSWQATGQDALSKFTDPLLPNETTPSSPADFVPPSLFPGNGVGANLLSVVSTDWYGNAFTTKPPAGAIIPYALVPRVVSPARASTTR